MIRHQEIVSDLAQSQKPKNLIAEAIRAKITTHDVVADSEEKEDTDEIRITEFSTKIETKITTTALPKTEIKCLNDEIDASAIQDTSKIKDTRWFS